MTTINVTQPWTRSQNGWIAGVCQGLGERFDLQPGLIRLVWAASVLFLGAGLLFYFICAICLPLEGREEQVQQPKVLGVCYRLSQRMDIDVGLLRILAIVIGLGSFGTTILAYFIIHFLLPEQRVLKEVKTHSNGQ